MTQIDVVDKQADTAPRRDFLKALYGSAPEDLYLELRCIHPTTGEVKTLWSRIGDKRGLASAFRQAEALNRDGYGLYFAPCLRRDKQGKAEAAAWVPALWIDIDGLDDLALERLRSFDPPPAFIIDSGGGWHAYWLLDEPLSLAEADDRARLASVLRGLFAELGGDAHYVKSAASVMRLPQSVNTKPERGGAIVRIVDSCPERKARFAAFAWLEKPQEHATPAHMNHTHNGNGRHTLPKRTEEYLASGAPSGSRNAELFAAACQMRDAGYSQSEAEHDLVPRHIANGSTELEARATIKSAYSRPRRDPILSPQERVDWLVSQFQRTEQAAERPTAAQIAEAVKACAILDPVEWAEERQRLKGLCGDGLRLTDLDRLYREARRARERESADDGDDNERYLAVDGVMMFDRCTGRSFSRRGIADWTGTVREAMMHIDDDGQVEHITRLELTRGDKVALLDVPSELFGDPNALARFIAGKAGAAFSPRAGMQKHLAPAILALSGIVPERQTYRFLGWTELDGQWTYVSPQVCLNGQGLLETPPKVELESRLRDYRLSSSGWDDALSAFKAAIAVFPKELAPALIAFTFLPIVQRFFPSAAPKPAMHLVGTTGSGKSEIAALMTSFYGEFTRDTPPAQWGDTVNTVEALGYALADALYWVDDYKACYADEKTFTRFLQSYSRGMGRGRLTREARVRQDRPCRGLLLSTGETTIEGEASVLSRMLVLEIPPWEKRDPDGRAFAQAERLRAHLPGFTAAFVSWLASRIDEISKDLAERYAINTEGYRAKLTSQLGRQANTGRMIGNWAVLLSVFQVLHNFLIERDADDALPLWRDAILETIRAVQEERAGRVFLDMLAQLIAGGQCVIDADMRMPREYPSGVTVVGYQDDGFVYLLPDIALREVSRMQAVRFTTAAIGAQLREEGILIPGGSNLTVQKRVRGGRVRFWQLRADSLLETSETPETGGLSA